MGAQSTEGETSTKNERSTLIRIDFPKIEKRMSKWNCIEDRVDNGTKYGRIIRKIIQGDIFADKTAVFSSNPIPPNALRHLNVSGLEIQGRLIKGSQEPSHLFFEINVGKSRIRNTTTLKLKEEFLD